MRRAVRNITRAAVAVVLVGCALWVFAQISGDNELAVVHDTRLEPAVPMGALAVMHDATGYDPGDVVGTYPASRSELERFVFGPRGVARAGHLFEPDEPSFGGSDAMAYYIPVVGYVVWFGPIGLLVFFTVALIALDLTRGPQRRVFKVDGQTGKRSLDSPSA